jgi:hypothetical protein
MVGDRHTRVWPEDQVVLAPTGASILGSPSRVGRIDGSHLEIGFGVVGPVRASGEKRDTAEGSGNRLTTRLGNLKGEPPAAGSARRGPRRMIRALRAVVGTK